MYFNSVQILFYVYIYNVCICAVYVLWIQYGTVCSVCVKLGMCVTYVFTACAFYWI